MRFMILRKSDQHTEAGRFPDREMLVAMGRYRKALEDAGVLIGGDGLLSSAKGARITATNGRVSVTDGPFAETKELIAGFLLLEVDSIQTAIEWAKRCPTMNGEGCVEMEVRQVVDIGDFPVGLTTELCDLPWTTVSEQARGRRAARSGGG